MVADSTTNNVAEIVADDTPFANDTVAGLTGVITGEPEGPEYVNARVVLSEVTVLRYWSTTVTLVKLNATFAV